MNVGTWSSQSGRFSSATVHAVPVRRTQATRLRPRRRKVRTSEPWILLLAGIAVALAGYTTVQTMMFTLERDTKPGTSSTAAMMLVSSEAVTTSPSIAPIDAEQSDRPAGRTGSEHEVSAPQMVLPARGSTKLGPSPLYDLAAARYGLDSRMLRALHDVESTASSSGCTANRQGSGALGADSRPDSDRTHRALLRYGTPAAQVVARTARAPR